ncbi:MAG: hypothetical protein KKA99_05915 [Gammaproteobacteria bacterium]|nr:hypothetical protein [Gammaproteobacteria bacterium]MBU1559065.1 hypothetical protein [Gammaproteobacteria bacterium]MBU1926582.1 hypothetical protein [Gammaproteobacteria bacterium]
MQQPYSNQELIQRFKESMTFLKQHHFSEKEKKTPFFNRPWYLIIGKTGVGKTSILKNSGLKFSLERKIDASETSFQTHLFDWWVSKNALIMDVSGTYYEENDEQYALLLKLLKKNCYKKTLAGIMVVLEIDDLLQFEENTIQTLKKQISLIKKICGKQTPFYLLINKLDHLNGFFEFFDDSSLDERSQICGFPLRQKGKIEHQLNPYFSSLTQNIYDQLVWRLRNEPDTNKRALINDFPQQIVQLHPQLHRFLKNLQKNKLLESIKGLYLTSALSCSLNTITNQEEKALTALWVNPYPNTQRAFFIHDLLEKKIFSNEPYALSKTSRKLRTIGLSATILFLITVSLLTVAYLFYAFKNEMSRLNNIEEQMLAAQATLQTNASNQTYSLPKILKILNQLETNELQINHKHLLLNPLNKSAQLKQKMLLTHQQLINKSLLPTLSNLFSQALTKKDLSNDSLYCALASYLMLTTQTNFDPAYIVLSLQNIFGDRFSTETYSELLIALQKSTETKNAPQAINTSRVRAAQDRLKALSPKELATIILNNETPNNRLLSLNLKTNETAASVLTFINYDTAISSMFTRQAFQFIEPQMIHATADAALNGNWVIGEIDTKHKASEKQVATFEEELSQMYKLNYADAWLQFINNIQMVNYTNIHQLKAALDTLTSDESPLLQLIGIIQDNLVSPVASMNPKLQALKNIPTDDDNNQASVAHLKNVLTALNAYISPLTNSDHSDQTAFQLASYRMRNHGKNDPIEQLLQISQLYPNPIKTWIYNLGMNAWQLILFQTENYLNTAWQTTIFPQYKAQLANRFPFQISSSNEVSLDSFKYFFATNGLFNVFLTHNLAPFIDTSEMPWKLKNMDGITLAISNNALQALEKAYEIQHLFFSGSQNLHIPFTVQPAQMSDSIQNMTIAIGNQSADFQNTSPNTAKSFFWPDDMNANFVKVTLTDQKKNKTIWLKTGPWAWLKILNQGKVMKKENNQFTISIEKNQKQVDLVINTTDHPYPFDLENLFNFKLPEQFS